ncbi:SH3 domain-containing protein [bacterium]|nr:SH3 domain-containing protein [bacterium]
MKKIYISLIALVLAALACTSQSAQMRGRNNFTPAATTAPSQTASPTVPTARTVCAEHLNLRANAGVNATIVAVLSADTIVVPTGEMIERDGSAWAKVAAGELAGWVNVQYLCE